MTGARQSAVQRLQFFLAERLVDANELEKARRDLSGEKWLGETWARPINPSVRAALQARYGAKGGQTRHAESLQVCEYGRQPSVAELNEVFPK